MFDKFHPLLFLYVFCIGLVISRYFGDRYQYYIKYPLPYAEKDIYYENPDGSCYKYNFKPIECSDQCTDLHSEERIDLFSS